MSVPAEVTAVLITEVRALILAYKGFTTGDRWKSVIAALAAYDATATPPPAQQMATSGPSVGGAMAMEVPARKPQVPVLALRTDHQLPPLNQAVLGSRGGGWYICCYEELTEDGKITRTWTSGDRRGKEIEPIWWTPMPPKPEAS